MRQKISNATKEAMRAKNQLELSTLRLMSSAIQSKDIDARGKGNPSPIGDDEVLALLVTMVKQRRESAELYQKGERIELAEKELAEIEIIARFLPQKLSDDEVTSAIDAAILETMAKSGSDMGQVMAVLKAKYPGKLDFSKVSALVKARLNS